MISIEEFNKLKQANHILNRGTKKLGVKPMYIEQDEDFKPEKYLAEEVQRKQEAKKNNFVKEKIKQKSSNTPKPIQLQSELDKIAFKLKNEKSNFKVTNKVWVNLIYLLIGTLILGFVFLVMKPINQNKDAATKVEKITKQNSPLKTGKQLAICSGNFKRELEAKRYLNELEERLGVPLQLIKAGDLYTVQIGESYTSHDDAMIVFDELSRYSITNLSIRFL